MPEKNWESQKRIVDRFPMNGLEGELERQGFMHVAGVDEAGRGPLSGPVGAGFVILRHGFSNLVIRDLQELAPSII